MMKIPISQKKLPFLLLAISAAWICVFAILSQVQRSTLTDISNLSVKSEDKQITLAWETPSAPPDSHIELTITSSDSSTVVELAPGTTNYRYAQGKHGILYTFAVKVKDADGTETEGLKKDALFLDWDRLPDLPIVIIDTQNDQLPTYTEIAAPENYWGASITDNEYVSAHLTIQDRGTVTINSSAEIRVRGNTSAYSYKKPYKIKLEQGLDLLGRSDSDYKDTEWLLLPDYKTLKLETGLKTAELCGMQWEPDYTPVNVLLNGDWLGCYHLVESVKRNEARVDISSTGFLIENDPYWWNAEGNYFKTTHQHSKTGYTFKYPEAETLTDTTKESIQRYMEEAEQAILSGTDDYLNYVDADSFAAWLLTHDILGTWDSSGSNIYLYKHDLSKDEPYASKLKMGPAWDFETCFQMTDTWARIHKTRIIRFDLLLQQDAFSQRYTQKWTALSSTLTEDIHAFLTDYIRSRGNALQESWDLDARRWNTPQISAQDALEDVTDWFSSRTVWLNSNIGNE